MKIIGNNGSKWSGGKEYILIATQTEIANLMGYHYSSEVDIEKRLEQKDANIPISKMFGRLYTMANKEKELMEISAKLKASADFINSALPTIQIINKEE